MTQISYELANKNVTLSLIGDLSLLERPKISIVGTRKPNQYSQEITATLAQKLSQKGVVIVSGGAIGVDSIAHQNTHNYQSICIQPAGLNHLYPAINKNLFTQLASKGLLISQFDADFKATNWSFVARNELVVALGEILIVTEADLKSGSMTSVEFALKQSKPIFVPTHRIKQSEGTNSLLQHNLAKPIYDIDVFINEYFGDIPKANAVSQNDPFLKFCEDNPNYDAVFRFDSQKLFEYELLGKIKIINQKIVLI